MWRHAGRALFDFVFPPGCVLCVSDLSREPPSDGLAICNGCREELPPDDANMCARCGALLGPFASASGGCVHCRNESFAFSAAVSLGPYDGRLREACLRGKQHGSEPVLGTLAGMLWFRRAEEISAWNCDTVVPVPQHWFTRWHRAHNPAELIAADLAGRLGIPHRHRLLRKSRHTARQVTLTATGRRQNLRNAFAAARPRQVRDLRILLVDDVLTTGATVQACARALRQAGAAEIFAAVLARSLG